MAKFIITEADGRHRDFPLDKTRISIGRHADNDICLSDKSISGHHAVVSTFLGDWFLEDLGSTNGTQVNGGRTAKHVLSAGDVVSIGRNTLRYESGTVAVSDDIFDKAVAATAAEETQSPQPQPEAPTEVPPATARALARPPVGRLRVASGPDMGKELELSKALTTVGHPGGQIAAFTRRIDGFHIVHVGESNAGARPLLNKVEIDMQARKLSDGDVIELVGTLMIFLQDP